MSIHRENALKAHQHYSSYNNYFLYKNILIFQDTISSKYTPKRTKLHHIFKTFSGSICPRAPTIYECK